MATRCNTKTRRPATVRAFMLVMLTALTLACSSSSVPHEPLTTPLSEEAMRAIVREEVARALAAREVTPTASCDIAIAMTRALPSVLRIEVRRAGTQIVTGRGSGFVALAGGIVLTAAHVIGAPPVDIALYTVDGRRMAAELLRVDAALDLAVVRAADRRLPAIRWADTGGITLGESVRVAGFPFNRPDVTVTGGVLARRSPATANRREELVTDADADPGNSGGPLLTACGEALGVVVQRTITTGTSTVAVGAGTALPFTLAAVTPPAATPTSPLPVRTP